MPKEQERCAPIRRNKASKEARSAIAKNESGSKSDETHSKIELTNLDEIYLEQDWFYLSQDPDDHANTCLRQLPGTNRDSAEIAREAVANGARGGRRKSVRSICLLLVACFVVCCCLLLLLIHPFSVSLPPFFYLLLLSGCQITAANDDNQSWQEERSTHAW